MSTVPDRSLHVTSSSDARGNTARARPYAVVTGGAGFLGSHVVDRLVADGYEVAALDVFFTGSPRNLAAHAANPYVHVITHDVRESLMHTHFPRAAALSKLPATNADNADKQSDTRADAAAEVPFRIDRIFHFACPAAPDHYQSDPVFTTMTCVQGTYHALQLATHHDCPVLIASTSEVYGDPIEHPQKETYWGNVNCTGVRACYDEGKRCAEALAFDFHRQHGTKIRVARIFNTYGPRMTFNDGRVVSNFVLNALRATPLVVYGDGTQTRSLQYVDDLVEAVCRFTAHPTETGPLNLGSQDERTVAQIAANVLDAVETVQGTRSSSAVVHAPPAEDDPHYRLPDTTRAHDCLGQWCPQVALEDGLVRTARDFYDRLREDKE